MREIHNILCPVDLSDVSQCAIDHALLLAGWYGATITALHVCNPLVIPSTDFTVAGMLPPPVLAEDDILNAQRQVAAWFSAAPTGMVNVIVESGGPANRILEIAQSTPTDLVVIGTHGIGGFEHLVLGSVTEKVLRRATLN